MKSLAITASIAAFNILCACHLQAQPPMPEIKNFEECFQAGYPTTKSMPPICMAPDGRKFAHDPSVVEGHAICKNLCGDGECQEIVCMGRGCPCPETSQSCPADCR